MKNILITGASRGIGFETARILALSGHNVIAVARSGEALATLKSKASEKIYTIVADLSLADNINKTASYLHREEIILDGLIHNAGLLINKPFSELEDSDWQKMINVNVMIPVRLTRKLIPYLATGSHIVNISSMGGYQESSKFPGLAGYSVSKGALTTLSECLAVELSDKQISSNCLCLGAVQTEMLEEAFPGMDAPVSALDMGNYIADFVLTGHQFYNGKILPVALSDPD